VTWARSTGPRGARLREEATRALSAAFVFAILIIALLLADVLFHFISFGGD
jgi:hypothetical protein